MLAFSSFWVSCLRLCLSALLCCSFFGCPCCVWRLLVFVLLVGLLFRLAAGSFLFACFLFLLRLLLVFVWVWFASFLSLPPVAPLLVSEVTNDG